MTATVHLLDVAEPRTVHEASQRAQRLRIVAAELRAPQLVRCLTRALQNTPHWQYEARNLLDAIHRGEVPPQPPGAA